MWQAQYSEPGRRWSAAPVCVAGAVLVRQAQYSESLERVAGAVLRLSRKGCGAHGRRWSAAPVCVASAVLRVSRKGGGAPGRHWSAAPVGAAGAVLSQSLERVAARLVAASPRLLSVRQAQYSVSL